MSATSNRLEFRSRPALMMGAAMSTALVVFSFGMWFAMGPELRALFTPPQTGTLLFFLAVAVGMMVSVGMSSVVADEAGLVVRNAVWTRRFGWDEVRGVQFGEGDPWAYIRLAPTEEHPEGRTHMALAIQQAEGRVAADKVARLREYVEQHAV